MTVAAQAKGLLIIWSWRVADAFGLLGLVPWETRGYWLCVVLLEELKRKRWPEDDEA